MHKAKQKGFGVLEVIVAIFIVAVGLVSILALTNSYLRAAEYLKMKLTASFLAQEGIEIVRFTRESSSSWKDWYDSIFLTSTSYRVQYSDKSIADFRPDTATPLKINSLDFYQYISGNATPFERTVTLTKSLSADEVKVEVKVEWQDRGAWKYVKAEDRLWNWR